MPTAVTYNSLESHVTGTIGRRESSVGNGRPSYPRGYKISGDPELGEL